MNELTNNKMVVEFMDQDEFTSLDVMDKIVTKSQDFDFVIENGYVTMYKNRSNHEVLNYYSGATTQQAIENCIIGFIEWWNKGIKNIYKLEKAIEFFDDFRKTSGIELDIYSKYIERSKTAISNLKNEKTIISNAITDIEKWSGECYFTPETDPEKCPNGDEVFQALEKIKSTL